MIGSESGYDLALPGTWWEIPVDDEKASDRAIDRIIADAVGRRDEDATARQELRARFRLAATRARTAGASRLHLCREVVVGVPFPASLTAYRPPIPLVDRGERTLLDQLEAVVDPAMEPDDVTLDVPAGRVLRRVRVVEADEGSPEEGLTTLRVDYWLVPPSRRVLLLSFACGLPELREGLVELFDLVVGTLAWSPAD
ncbi:hypothetical protein ACFJGV_03740 [Cnuibacter sp. UC19_7]|uniref:hypothetical protein n=1 Tax=Cnuibacter sp. UC19_7 TaxID=3350166 RepID=UPI00366E5131